ncbi:MAG TPA: hypothetical protein ENH49_04215 [Candidatus Marinimicrobia bacterium]|nr:hypothetical protein [Candidatus Neomarinimicrobiota bacterium]
MNNLNSMFRVLIVLLFIIQGCKPFVTSDVTTDTRQGNRDIQKNQVSSQNKEEKFVKGELIIRFKDTATNQEIEKIIFSVGAKLLRTISKERKTFLILLPEELSEEDAIKELSKRTDILYAEPNRIYTLEAE